MSWALKPRHLRAHLSQDLYRTAYYLIASSAITSVLGVAFWSLAARSYTAEEVGLAAATISAMALTSGVCSLGLYPVLVRYLPVAGTATVKLIAGSYAVTATISLLAGAATARSSSVWSSKLSFLASTDWTIAFSAATAGTTIFTLQDGVLTGLRAAHWVPIENALYAAAKLTLLVALPGVEPFLAWNAPVLPAIVVINWLVFGRLLAREKSIGTLARPTVVRMAAANFGANVFSLASTFYLPVLVAETTSATDAAYFYVPWLIAISLVLVAQNMMTSLTVEAALDTSQLSRLARQTLIHTMRLVLPVAGITWVAAPYVLLIFGDDYADAGSVFLRWLALGALPNVFVALGMSIARVTHRSGFVVGAQALNAATLIGISAVLLPRVGIEGVGIAWASSQTLVALVMLTIVRPVLRSDVPLDVPSPVPSDVAGPRQ
jgi:O-antigen/teichoic acid export membrane protein